MVLMEEEVEHSRLVASSFGKPQRKAVVGSTSGAMVKVESENPLYKSFSEVGLLHADRNSDDDDDENDAGGGVDTFFASSTGDKRGSGRGGGGGATVNSGSAVIAGSEKIAQAEKLKLTNSLSLQLLERDLAGNELSRNIGSQSHGVLPGVSSSLEEYLGHPGDTSGAEIPRAIFVSEPRKVSAAAGGRSSSGPSRSETRTGTGGASLHSRAGDRYHSHTAMLETRLKQLNAQVQSNSALLEQHNKLADREGSVTQQQSQFSPKAKLDREIARMAPKNTRAAEERKLLELEAQVKLSGGGSIELAAALQHHQQLQQKAPNQVSAKSMVRERMEIIEKLQQLQFRKVTLRSAVTGFRAPHTPGQGADEFDPTDPFGATTAAAGLTGGGGESGWDTGSMDERASSAAHSESVRFERSAVRSKGVSMVKGGAGVSVPKSALGSSAAQDLTKLTLSHTASSRLALAGGLNGEATGGGETGGGAGGGGGGGGFSGTGRRRDGWGNSAEDDAPPRRYGKGYVVARNVGKRLENSIQALSDSLASKIMP